VPRPSSPVGAQSPGRTLVTVNCLAWWAGLLRGWVSAVPGALSSGRIRPVSLLRPRGGLLRGGGCPQFRRSPVPRAKRLGVAASPTEWAPTGVGVRGSVPAGGCRSSVGALSPGRSVWASLLRPRSGLRRGGRVPGVRGDGGSDTCRPSPVPCHSSPDSRRLSPIA
jgi:hypothetical protein